MLKRIINRYNRTPVQVRASLWFVVCAFLQKGISLITTPIFTRLLSTAEYGRFNVFTSWLSILTVIVTLDLYYGVYTRGLVKYESEREVLSSSLQGLTLSLVVCWGVIYYFFHNFWNGIFGLNTLQMSLMLLVMWTTAVFSFWSTKERVDFRYKKLVILTLIVSFAKPILGIVFVLAFDDRVTGRILAIALVELLAFSGLFVSQMKSGRVFYNAKFWKHALAFNIPLIPHYLSTSILNGADRIMIEKMIGESEAGIYALAYSVSMIMAMLNTALMQTIEPWMYKKINENRTEEISKVAYPSFVIIALVNIALIAFAPEAVALFAPSQYSDAIYVIPPVAMSVFFMFSYTFFAVFEFYYKKTKLVALATGFGAGLNILLNYVFINIFGYYAAGYTTLVCYAVYVLLHYIFMSRICKKELNGIRPYNMKVYLIIVSVFLGMGFSFLATYDYIVVRYAFIVFFVICVFVFRHKIIDSFKGIMSVRGEKDKYGGT